MAGKVDWVFRGGVREVLAGLFCQGVVRPGLDGRGKARSGRHGTGGRVSCVEVCNGSQGLAS